MDKLKGLRNLAGHLRWDRDHGRDFSLKNYGKKDAAASVEVVFEDIESRLLRLVSEAEVIVGCVAWLTNFRVLSAMRSCQFVNIVVQKEDYLRNDTSARDDDWARRLRAAYDGLRGKGLSMNIPELYDGHPHLNKQVRKFCVTGDGGWSHYKETVRCIGYSTASRNVTPKMHHKFLVFAYADDKVDLIPFAVWTGSYNITQNAELSRENVLLIRSDAIAHAYLSEWAQLWALSEPLDWTSQEPEKQTLYVGT